MDNTALRRGNALLALVHAAQAVVILALSTDFSLPVTGAFMEGQPGSGLPKQVLLFDLRDRPARRRVPVARSARPRSRRAPAVPRALRAVPRRGRQPVPLARVLAVGLADGRPDRDADRDRRLRRVARPLRSERGDDLPRLADGAAQPAGPCADALAAVRARLHRRRRGVDRHRGADRRLGGRVDMHRRRSSMRSSSRSSFCSTASR